MSDYQIPSLPQCRGRKCSGFSKSAKISKNESIIEVMLPDDIQKKLDRANARVDAVFAWDTRESVGGWRIVIPPVKERTENILAAWENLLISYEVIVEEIQNRWDVDVLPGIEAFYVKHPNARRRHPITKEEIRERFTPTLVWESIQDERLKEIIFTPEYIAAQEKMQQDAAASALSSAVEDHLKSLVKNLEKATLQASAVDGKPRKTNWKTIGNVEKAYEELKKIIPHTPMADKYSKSITEFAAVLEDIQTAREYCDDKDADGEVAIADLHVAVKKAQQHAQPMLETFALEIGDIVTEETEAEEEVKEEEEQEEKAVGITAFFSSL